MKLSIFSCLTMLRKAKNLNRLDDLVRKERSGWSAGVKGKGSASRRWQICSRNSPRAKLSRSSLGIARLVAATVALAFNSQSQSRRLNRQAVMFREIESLSQREDAGLGARPKKISSYRATEFLRGDQRASTCHLDCLLRHQGSKIVARRATTLVDSKLDHRTSESPEHCNPER